MGRQTGDQSRLFYSFNLEERVPERYRLARINAIVTGVLAELRTKLQPYYSEIGRPSIDPELTLSLLIVGYCYGIRFERKLCEELEIHLAYLGSAVSMSTTKCPTIRSSRSIGTVAFARATSFCSYSIQW